jgi:hypothetical protein
MSYENPTKTTLKNKFLEIIGAFPENLDEGQAEDFLFTVYEELGKVIDPDTERFPPVRP